MLKFSGRNHCFQNCVTIIGNAIAVSFWHKKVFAVYRLHDKLHFVSYYLQEKEWKEVGEGGNDNYKQVKSMLNMFFKKLIKINVSIVKLLWDKRDKEWWDVLL